MCAYVGTIIVYVRSVHGFVDRVKHRVGFSK